MHTRRHLIKGGTALAVLSTLPRPLLATLQQQPEPVPPIEDPRIKSLTDAALDVARSAGATYADVRLTHTFVRRFNTGASDDEESMAFGVRTLVDGYWGFTSSPVWTVDEAGRLARMAVRNARSNVLGKPRTLELAPITPAPNGHWSMPVKDDPFRMSRDEIADFFVGFHLFHNRIAPHVFGALARAIFMKQDKAFASTLGQYYTQRLYQSCGTIGAHVEDRKDVRKHMDASLTTLTWAGAGFEHFRDQPLRDQARARVEEAFEDLSLPVKPVDVGKYTVVFDAQSVANFLAPSIGVATELDRALGYEANAGGTSYITEPLEMVGTFTIGGPSLTVTANRSEPMGAATVKWDDEGVTPRDFTIVKNGILTDMQTNREGAQWLKSYYTTQQSPLGSSGCAYTPDAIYAPLTHCANLLMKPSADAATFASLIADHESGIAFKRAGTAMDFQQITGMIHGGTAFEVKKGKRVARLAGAGVLFRTPELWKSLTAFGGEASALRFGLEMMKGEPVRYAIHSATAVPSVFKDLTVIDTSRRA